MRVNGLNETGIILPSEKQVRFSYESKFYGECRFVAIVSETFENGLIIDNRTIRWEHQFPRHGGCEALTSSALVFFNRILRGYDSLRQFQMRLSTRRASGILGRISATVFGEKAASLTGLNLQA